MIRLSSHAKRKIDLLREFGIKVGEEQILAIVQRADGVQRSWKNRFVAYGLLDSWHMLRVIFEKENGNMVVVTFYPVRRRRYESQLR